MSTGNHYSKQVAALEAVLQSKLSQLSLLFEENKALRQRERALQAYQASLAGGLHATQKVLREASCSSYAVQGLPSIAMSGEDGLTAISGSDGGAGGSLSFSDGPALLQKIDEREEAVQQALRAIGGCEQAAYDELYTTQLLRRATAQPEHTVAILAMSIQQRLAYVTKCVERFALLLPKYDRTGASTRSGPASQQTDRLVDELSEKALTFGLLDAPGVHLSECMINMETGLPEAYPDGWWDPVVEAMKLTDEQHAALKVCYDRVKPVKDVLTAQHSALAAQLAQLQSSQHSKQRVFERGAQEVYSWVAAATTRGAAAAAAGAEPGMMPQAELLAWQAQRAEQLREQQVGEEGFGAFVEDVALPACGAAPTSTAASPLGTTTPPLQQHQQQQLRQVHLAAPVQRASSPSPQLQTSADAALQFRRSFLQPDAAAAAGWPAAAAPATPGAATSAAACTWLPASPNLATEEEGAAYQYDVIDAVLDGQLELEQVVGQGCGPVTAAAAAPAAPAAGYDALCSSSNDAQLLIGSAGHANNRVVVTPAAAAAPAGHAMQMLSREEVAAAVQRGAPDGCSSGAACQGLNSVIARSSSQCQRDLLMHVGSREQQQIEQEMDRITSQLKMQQYCLALHMHNVCSKKQIALQYLHCFPFIPEAFSFFEALESIWGGHTGNSNKL